MHDSSFWYQYGAISPRGAREGPGGGTASNHIIVPNVFVYVIPEHTSRADCSVNNNNNNNKAPLGPPSDPPMHIRQITSAHVTATM